MCRSAIYSPVQERALTLIAGEEHANAGTEEVLKSLTADAAAVTEPSHSDVTRAYKGFAYSTSRTPSSPAQCIPLERTLRPVSH